MRIEVASSDGAGSYTVTIEGKAGRVQMHCSCPAAENGQHCKHRIALVEGDSSRAFGGDLDQLPQLASWLPGSPLAAALAEKTAADQAVTDAKKRLKKANEWVARTMREG